jgi:hypothetical protein
MSRGEAVTVTNDGATILKSVYVDNPAAKVLVGEWVMGCPQGLLLLEGGRAVAAGKGGAG